MPGAPRGWAEVALPGVTDLAAVNEAFFDAASRGRRWRSGPTEHLSHLVAARSSLAAEYAEALTEVAAAAVMLGTAPRWVIDNATAASAAHLAAARSAGRPGDPLTVPSRGGGLPPLPPGPGTDAVLRAWGLTRDPSSVVGGAPAAPDATPPGGIPTANPAPGQTAPSDTPAPEQESPSPSPSGRSRSCSPSSTR